MPQIIDWRLRGESAGFIPDPDQGQRLDDLSCWLAERAFPLGLTNYPTPLEVAEHGLLPTFTVFQLLPELNTGAVLDLGAGSGALGLTLAILRPNLTVTMADRRQRATRFMNLTRARLGIANAHVRQVSAQELAKEPGSRFNLVCFRALAQAEAALGLAGPLLAPGGSVCIWHSSEAPEYLSPPAGWARTGTAPTALARLSVSRFAPEGGVSDS
ncbi:MAG TPA: RsmG family class I SAM-dependent methyltransferase [Armatimonadota bacterium]|jgi:16S rRNA G527 N7-methylase RsmG